MVKQPFNVRLEKETLEQFKQKCSDDGLTQVDVITALMEMYVLGKITIQKPKAIIIADQ